MVFPRLANPKHEDRYRRHVILKQTIEEIAAHDGVGMETVRNSIEAVQMQRGLANREEMERVQFSMLQSVSQQEQEALQDALKATLVKKEKGKDVTVPDRNIRLRAVEAISSRIAALQPKGKGVSVGVNVMNANTARVDSSAVAQGVKPRSMEEIIRRMQEVEGKALPEPDGQVIEAQVGESAEPDGVHTT